MSGQHQGRARRPSAGHSAPPNWKISSFHRSLSGAAIGEARVRPALS